MKVMQSLQETECNLQPCSTHCTLLKTQKETVTAAMRRRLFSTLTSLKHTFSPTDANIRDTTTKRPAVKLTLAAATTRQHADGTTSRTQQREC